MESLFDSLNLPSPERPAAPVDPWPEKLTGKEFAERVVNSIEFRQYILMGVRSGELPQAVMCRLMDHAWGQPVKRVELNDVTDPLMDVPLEELRTRLQQLQLMVQMVEDSKQQEQHVQEQTERSLSSSPTHVLVH